MKTTLGRLLGSVVLVVAFTMTASPSSFSQSPPQEPGPNASPSMFEIESRAGKSSLPDTRNSSEWPLDAQSTTGPVPPAGVERGMRAPVTAQQALLAVPAYIWHNGCGPTAAGMVIGYWDGNGFEDLVGGSAATQTAAVNTMISSSGNYSDYCLPLDYWPDPIQPDKSEPPVGDEHPDDCVADLMKTSQSFHSNYYGWSWFSHVDDAMEGYSEAVSPEHYAMSQNQTWGAFNWGTYRAEIDAGRPVVLLVDTDANGSTDHFVTAIGYSDAGGTLMYACRDTWDSGVHWFEFAQMHSGQPWGIYGATLFHIHHVEDVVFVPLVMKNFTPGAVQAGIYGSVTDNGGAAAAVSLDLRFYDGSSYSTMASTTTGADGRYRFAGIPSLGSGQRYYVQYVNRSATPGRLWSWNTWSIRSYSAGSNLQAGDFDIADIALVSPADGASVSLPHTFSWTPRPATPTDDYEFDLLDGEWWYTDPTLGYAGEYTLNSLPSGFDPGTEYWWQLCVYGPYGYGWSYEARAVTFSNTGAAAAASALPGRRVPPEEMEDFVPRP